MSKKWNDENVAKFASLLEENGCLWRKADETYRNKFKKEAAYQHMASEMSCSVAEIKTKMKSYRTTFFQYYHKSEKSGSGGGKQSSWKFFNNFIFLTEEIGFAGGIDSIDVSYIELNMFILPCNFTIARNKICLILFETIFVVLSAVLL